jgi:hypothetical protein
MVVAAGSAGLYAVTNQKIVAYIPIAMRTSPPMRFRMDVIKHNAIQCIESILRRCTPFNTYMLQYTVLLTATVPQFLDYPYSAVFLALFSHLRSILSMYVSICSVYPFNYLSVY